MKMSQISQNLQRIRKKIFKQAAKDTIKIVAVTKTRPATQINEAISCGVTSIGENRVQEAEQKFQQIKRPVEKRFIGRLQSNKAKKATALFDTIDSVHSYALADKISKHCAPTQKEQRVLLQINTGKEDSKSGFSLCEKSEIIKCFSLSNIKIEGLMTIAPLTKDKTKIKKAFQKLKELFLETNSVLPKAQQMTELSMGMSDDLLVAIKEGSTMVRVGTAIFGERKRDA